MADYLIEVCGDWEIRRVRGGDKDVITPVPDHQVASANLMNPIPTLKSIASKSRVSSFRLSLLKKGMLNSPFFRG
jgi:hypothetical protein